jgi:hypothetical protein
MRQVLSLIALAYFTHVTQPACAAALHAAAAAQKKLQKGFQNAFN